MAVALRALFGIASLFAIGLFVLLMSSGTASASPRPHDSGPTSQVITINDPATSGDWQTTSDLLTAQGFSGSAGDISWNLGDGSDSGCALSKLTGLTTTVTETQAGTCFVVASIAADSTHDSATSDAVSVVFFDFAITYAADITAALDAVTAAGSSYSTLTSTINTDIANRDDTSCRATRRL